MTWRRRETTRRPWTAAEGQTGRGDGDSSGQRRNRRRCSTLCLACLAHPGLFVLCRRRHVVRPKMEFLPFWRPSESTAASSPSRWSSMPYLLRRWLKGNGKHFFDTEILRGSSGRQHWFPECKISLYLLYDSPDRALSQNSDFELIMGYHEPT